MQPLSATGKTRGGSEGAALIRQEAHSIKAGVVIWVRGETVELANLEFVYLEPGATQISTGTLSLRFTTLYGTLSPKATGSLGKLDVRCFGAIALLFTTAVVVTS
jgi:hypothetical protein